MTEIETNNAEGSDWIIGKMPIIERIWFNMECLPRLKALITEFKGNWMQEAINLTKLEMDNCEKKAIRNAQAELIKAKALMKNKYPFRYKLEYYKVLFRNPIKTLYAKWRLR